MELVACSGQYLHSDGVADDDVGFEKLVDPFANGATGVAEELHPC
jgi:hypothetical protein